eukprot:COSAG01_NODE_825_length_13294_cov_30.659038_5_plen_223_part_00
MLSAFFYGYGCTNLLGGLLCRRLGGASCAGGSRSRLVGGHVLSADGGVYLPACVVVGPHAVRATAGIDLRCNLPCEPLRCHTVPRCRQQPLCFCIGNAARVYDQPLSVSTNLSLLCHDTRYLWRDDSARTAGPGCVCCRCWCSGWHRIILPCRPAGRGTLRMAWSTEVRRTGGYPLVDDVAQDGRGSAHGRSSWAWDVERQGFRGERGGQWTKEGRKLRLRG